MTRTHKYKDRQRNEQNKGDKAEKDEIATASTITFQ